MSLFKRKLPAKKFINSQKYLLCPKCGAPLKTDSRYCMKCGAINYDHPDNEYMKRYVSTDQLDEANRKYFEEQHTDDNTNDVYIGGEKVQTEKEKKEEEEKEVIKTKDYVGDKYLLLSFILSIIAILVMFLYFFS